MQRVRQQHLIRARPVIIVLGQIVIGVPRLVTSTQQQPTKILMA